MAIIKCKMCGGDLNLNAGETVAECEYCGSKQTVPTADNEKMLTLFARANRLRFANEFDKAAGVYESIVTEFPEEAEAYWGLLLCKYGIEYVDDPATGKKVPTCHRSSFDSVMDDTNLEQACENADAVARRVYREEAKAIEELRKGIIEVSGKEEPYDIFICYKETAENGERTLDSVLAQDIYTALTEKGYRVFFSRVTLEDKLGQEYEPYIFAALHSAKIMLAVGTDYEYYNAVWVKNEWSRYLSLIASGEKKTLIPCYKGIDAYDMPKEFARLQAQDLGKVGAMQDLLRGIEKLLPKSGAEPQTQVTAVPVSAPNVIALLKRGNMALEDGEWEKADEYFDSVLNMDAECAEAYLGKFLAAKRKANIRAQGTWLFENQSDRTLTRAVNYAAPNLKKTIDDAKARSEEIVQRGAQARRQAEEAFIREAKERQRIEEARLQQYRKKLAPIREKNASAAVMIAAGTVNTVGLYASGVAVATECTDYTENYHGQCDVSAWENIVAIAAGFNHTIGLHEDGTVVATKYTGSLQYYGGQCDVSGWTNIIAISAGDNHTVGLRRDGKVVATGKNNNARCNVSGWADIVAIAAGSYFTAGLRADGTVEAVGVSQEGRRSISSWKLIVAISAGAYHTVGLREEGTVVATKITGEPQSDWGQCDLSEWKDIVAISAGRYHTVGLRADGTVVAAGCVGAGQRNRGQCDVSGWKNIVAISAGDFHTVGLRADGVVMVTKYMGSPKFYYGRCDVSGWKLFQSIDTLEQERKDGKERRRKYKEARIEALKKEKEALQQEKATLQQELVNLKGFFSGGQRKKLEAQIEEIDRKLQICSTISVK